MNLNEVRTLVQAMEERQTPQPLLLAGTVGNVSDNGILSVVMDGDPENSEIDVTTLVSDVSPGDRVMVFFDPPRGVYAIGVLNKIANAGQVLSHLHVIYDDEIPFVAGDITPQGELICLLRGGRKYRFDFTATFRESDADYFPWAYGWVLNQNGVPFGQFFTGYYDFLVGYSLESPAGLGYVTITAFRIVDCVEDIVETYDVYLNFGGGTFFEGEFELAVTDAGPLFT